MELRFYHPFTECPNAYLLAEVAGNPNGAARGKGPGSQGKQATSKAERHGDLMRGQCDACGHLKELFEFPGRKDRNCGECRDDIVRILLLWDAREEAKRKGWETAEIDAELAEVEDRLMKRSGFVDPNVSE